MYLANLTAQQFLDFSLLETLANANSTIYKLSPFELLFESQKTIDSTVFPLSETDNKAQTSETLSKLVVLGEGLNLEKLQQINTEFAELTIQSWQVSPKVSGEGVVAKAHLSKTFDNSLNSKIAQLANRLHVELALVQQPPKLQEGGLMVMDMDSTLIAVECIDEIAKLAGLGDKVAEITELAMQGKLDFRESLYNRVACLQGVDVTLLQGIRDRLPLMPGLSKLVHVMQQHQWKIAIASGGFTFFADYLKERLNLCEAVSNVLEVADGKLTGKVIGEVIDANAKAATLKRLAEHYHVPASQTIAVGDGANDLVMMAEAAFGVAYHAKPVVGEKASVAIRFGGLDTLLEFLD
ncbi:phosphoserine phosphatase SerB [Planctobacterium marinum]|uniref:Phosphoserine phosphatase n=1 Tax=Planctobacterium marinum TaxID=1631968 RepID=A0AA48HHV5_9ALTE|nr:phosphoserine phosphatase [Planctobacterium marinum]